MMNGREERSGRALVDADLNPPGSVMVVVLNTALAAGNSASRPVGETATVKRTSDGIAYVEIHSLPPSEGIVLINHP
jgi:hypothetical protein